MASTTTQAASYGGGKGDGGGSTAGRLRWKSLLIPPLLLALYLIEDPTAQHEHAHADADIGGGGLRPRGSSSSSSHHYPAFVSALRAHPPSLRVFRCLSELALLLICAALSLRVWESTFTSRRRRQKNPDDDGRTYNEIVGVDVIGHLLFRPAVPPEEDRGEDGPGDVFDCASSVPDTALDDDDDEDDSGEDFLDAEATIRRDDDEVGIEERYYSAHSSGSFDEYGAEEELLAIGSPPPSAPRTGQSTNRAKAKMTMRTDDPSSSYRPPSASSVAGAAMDLLILILFFLVCFTLSANNVAVAKIVGHNAAGAAFSRIAAPVFPLVLCSAAMVMAVWPWNVKKGFWKVVSFTVEAPMHDVSFRDGFVGDILTSAVRPLQDAAFTLFYLLSGLRGWWSSLYDLDEAGAAPLERNWLLHTVVLPACMISPLWCRFLQNLRQAYSEKRRWPYLGNAFKYLIAAEVALFGVFDPSNKRKAAWILAFFCATLYQVWWDVFMDWELLVVRRRPGGVGRDGRSRPRWSVSLREERLYGSDALYWTILVVNVLLRFCWTLSFIPPRYLSRSGQLVETFSVGLQNFVVPAVASAEIIRRTLWGWIRVELAAIKLREEREAERGVGLRPSGDILSDDDGGEVGGTRTNMMEMEIEMEPMAIGSSSSGGGGGGHLAFLRQVTWTSSSGGMLRSPIFVLKSDMSDLSDVQILGELSVWATVFASLGVIAAAHRQ